MPTILYSEGSQGVKKKKVSKNNVKATATFLDFKKVINSIQCGKMVKILQEYRIPERKKTSECFQCIKAKTMSKQLLHF